jgi:hypothetical protein
MSVKNAGWPNAYYIAANVDPRADLGHAPRSKARNRPAPNGKALREEAVSIPARQVLADAAVDVTNGT